MHPRIAFFCAHLSVLEASSCCLPVRLSVCQARGLLQNEIIIIFIHQNDRNAKKKENKYSNNKNNLNYKQCRTY